LELGLPSVSVIMSPSAWQSALRLVSPSAWQSASWLVTPIQLVSPTELETVSGGA
jgi:hypothetical protein